MSSSENELQFFLTDEEIKRAELDMLIAFDSFAKENSITYSLAYGTLLGAIRHKGFIPWDDDIDVIVPRPDYDRLIKMGQSNRRIESYSLSGYDIDGFPMPFIKMIDSNIRVNDAATRDNLPLWLWIDIFPLDGCVSSIVEYEKLDKQVYFCKSLIKSANYKFLKAGKSPLKRLVKMIIKPFVYILKLNRWAERRLAYLAHSGPSYDEAEYVSNLVWGPYRIGERLPKKWFKKTERIEFEGHSFDALVDWDPYLRSIYGDYLKLPPKSQQIAHGIAAWRMGEESKYKCFSDIQSKS